MAYLGLLSALPVVGQSGHFSQFYAVPLHLNPALTGAIDGKYRIGAAYRDQWRRALDNPLQTYAVGADLRFSSPNKSVFKDAVGVGIQFMHDKVNVLDFNTTQIALSGAYHKSLDVNNRQYLTLGVQGGLTQRNVNYAPLQFHDMFDGVNGYVLPTGEALPANNIAFLDVNTGLNYTSRIDRYGAFFAGVSVHHANRPQVSFYEDKELGGRLYRRYGAQVAAHLPLRVDNHLALMPRMLFSSQGPHMELNAGATVRTTFGQFAGSAFHAGGYARMVRNDFNQGLGALVAMAGIEFNGLLFGLSYDVSTTALRQGRNQSALEFTLTFLGSYENEEIICPKF